MRRAAARGADGRVGRRPAVRLFAATYPEKTEALDHDRQLRAPACAPPITRGGRPPRSAISSARRSSANGAARSASTNARRRARSILRFATWWSAYLRMGASPGAAVALTRMNAEDRHPRRAADDPRADAGHPSHRRSLLKVEEGRYLASHIPGREIRRVAGGRSPAVRRRSAGVLSASDVLMPSPNQEFLPATARRPRQ